MSSVNGMELYPKRLNSINYREGGMALNFITNIVLVAVLVSLIVAFAKPLIENVRKKTYGKDFWLGF